MRSDGQRQVGGPLRVAEAEGAWLVVLDDDPEDWLVRFEDAEGFAARDWAENMARVYNRRLSHSGDDPRWSARAP